VVRRRGRRPKQLLDDLKERREYWKTERGNTRSHCVENWPWKRLWTCCKTNCGMRMANTIFLISNFRRVFNIVFFLSGDSPASELCADVS
jgi:hypothetical protein